MTEIKINIDDFEKIDNENGYKLKNKSICVFNQTTEANRVNIRLNDKTNHLENHLISLHLFLLKLSDFKKELISFYNNTFSETEVADELWYNNLEVYRVTVFLGLDSKWYADVTAGDQFYEDHLLDIELEENAVFSMNYDG